MPTRKQALLAGSMLVFGAQRASAQTTPGLTPLQESRSRQHGRA